MPAPKRAAAMMAGCALLLGAAVQADDLEVYRQMLADPFANPGLLAADEGEVLWRTPAGPKNATLEGCDLGLGAGVVEGAFAQMPRYFEDAGRVMDVDTRIGWCRQELQGIPMEETAKTAFSRRGGKADMERLVLYVATQSAGMPLQPQASHPKEQEAYALGEAMFFRRAGTLDYSCATCHSATGARIRLQELPNLLTPEGAAVPMTTWPTYRVSHESVRTMQHRMWDCYWQMRMPDIAWGSDVSIGLITYMAQNAAGAELAVPGLKR